jgi:hypothetical protein
MDYRRSFPAKNPQSSMLYTCITWSHHVCPRIMYKVGLPINEEGAQRDRHQRAHSVSRLAPYLGELLINIIWPLVVALLALLVEPMRRWLSRTWDFCGDRLSSLSEDRKAKRVTALSTMIERSWRTFCAELVDLFSLLG